MPYYLAPFEIGASYYRNNVCRPADWEPGSSFIDLRADGGATPDGNGLNMCILERPSASSDGRLLLLGHAHDDTIGEALRVAVRSALNLSEVTASTVAGLIRDLLNNPPPHGWNPLNPTRLGLKEIYLSDKLYTNAGAAGSADLVDVVVDEQVAIDFIRKPHRRRWLLQIFGISGLLLAGALLGLHPDKWGPFVIGMALPKSDAFTAANGTGLSTYNASWVYNQLSFRINTNAVCSASGTDDCLCHWEGDTFNDDQYAQGTVVAQGADYIGVAVRCAAGSTVSGYWYTGNNSGRILAKIVAGTYTERGSTSARAVNDVISLDASGSTITAKLNGANDTGVSAPWTDTSLTNGYAGLQGFGSNNVTRLDAWEGGNLAGAVGHPAMRRTGHRPAGVNGMIVY